MADLRSWSKELIIDLINQYKSFPCLWKIKSDEYRNKNLKEDAYKKLIDFCKGEGFTDANRDFVVKKIQSLRGSFRKELKKQVDSQRSGTAGTDEVYTPTLWYFSYLLFTKDQELPTPSFENTADENYTSKDVINENEETIQERNEFEQQNESLEEIIGNVPSVANKKRKMSSNNQVEFFKVCTDTLNSTKQLTESEIVGMNMAKKLEKMDPLQAIYAESIINNVLRRGLLKKLTDNSDVCDNNCQQKIQTPSSFTSETTNTSSLASTSKDGQTEENLGLTQLRVFSAPVLKREKKEPL